MLGVWEIITIVIIILIAFQWFGNKAPEVAKTAGKTVKEFKKAVK